jgi:hypothetical protein
LRSNVPRAMDSRANHSCASCCCSKPSRTSLDCGRTGWRQEAPTAAPTAPACVLLQPQCFTYRCLLQVLSCPA